MEIQEKIIQRIASYLPNDETANAQLLVSKLQKSTPTPSPLDLFDRTVFGYEDFFKLGLPAPNINERLASYSSRVKHLMRRLLQDL